MLKGYTTVSVRENFNLIRSSHCDGEQPLDGFDDLTTPSDGLDCSNGACVDADPVTGTVFGDREINGDTYLQLGPIAFAGLVASIKGGEFDQPPPPAA